MTWPWGLTCGEDACKEGMLLAECGRSFPNVPQQGNARSEVIVKIEDFLQIGKMAFQSRDTIPST